MQKETLMKGKIKVCELSLLKMKWQCWDDCQEMSLDVNIQSWIFILVHHHWTCQLLSDIDISYFWILCWMLQKMKINRNWIIEKKIVSGFFATVCILKTSIKMYSCNCGKKYVERKCLASNIDVEMSWRKWDFSSGLFHIRVTNNRNY